MAEYNKRSIRDLDVRGKRVLLRVDFNVPLDEDGNISDDGRIRAALPTIKALLSGGARLIVASHLGRPKGQAVAEMSLKPVAMRLGELLGTEVAFAADCVGAEAEDQAKSLGDGQILLLENVRFHPGEEANEENFARQLASLAEIFVNDAFGTAHRAHASTEGVTRFLSPCVAGLLIEKELEFLGSALGDPKRPAVALLGGAKVSSKIDVITNLLTKMDTILVGGGMAFTFLKAQGFEIGTSLFEEETFETAKEILARSKEAGVANFLLPTDCIIADKFSEDAQIRVVDVREIPQGWMGLDIGPETIGTFSGEIAEAGTVVWNGPQGVFEMEPFAAGTREIAQAVAESPAVTILGGGETAAAAESFGVAERMTHVSTGGGASLEFLESKVLPGIAALDDA